MDQNDKYEGWAVVELFGHTKETGFVTTRYFGDKAMFQIDIPDLPEREVTTTQPGYVGNKWTDAGAVVKKSAVPARSRLVGPGAVYSMNPCTEEFARRVIDQESRAIAIIALPPSQQIQSGDQEAEYPEDDDSGINSDHEDEDFL